MRRTATAVALALLLPAAAPASFEDPESTNPDQELTTGGPQQRADAPDDPAYDRAEGADATTTNLYDERYDLFGFPSKHTPLARYLAGPHTGSPQVSGFNAAGAWKLNRGHPDVVVAVLDTGIRWDNRTVRKQVHLNADELPLPRRASDDTDPGAGLNGYDLNRNGALDVDDYAEDARVGRAAPTGQDLIRTFSDGKDDGGNGYVDDIAGWDFFDDDNDPDDSSSYFAAANHGTGRVREAVERANDGEDELGVCPKCQFTPIRVWDTFVSDQTTFALGILYSVDNGVSVIVGADGGLYHSAFAERASDYAWEQGVVQVYSGDDLNTANHNYPAAYGHAMLIQGVATDTQGLGTDAGSPDSPVGSFPGLPAAIRNALREAARPIAGLPAGGTELPVGTYFRSANTAQFGGKSSISMEGPTGSTNTGKAGGAAGLVISAARAKGIALDADETRVILEQTAEDVLSPNTLGTGTPDPAQPGWDSHFGWGRVNLGAAVKVANSGDIPPAGAITSPDWYAPLTADAAEVKGIARADSPFTWRLEWGVGQAPLAWNEVASGASTAPVTSLGTLNLAAIRAALDLAPPPVDPAGPVFSPAAPHPLEREFAVQLTITVGGDDTVVDRRVFNAFTDPTLRPGFPKRLGAGGEAPLRYADLDGDDVQELVAPVEDGTIHAWRPDGSELPGWPVHTELVLQAANHLDAPAVGAVAADAPPREPPRAPLIVDLDLDGAPEVVTAAGRHIYAWQADGKRRPGFPVSIDPNRCRGEDNNRELVHRKCGFLATPAAARLVREDERQSIVASALDGHLYAFDGAGTPRPGFPVELVDPSIPAGEQMKAESINQAAIGDLDEDGIDDIVVATNETYDAEVPGPDELPGLIARGLSALLANAAGGSSRLYAVSGETGEFLDGWPVRLNGAIQDTLPLIGPGHDAVIAEIGGERVVVASTTGSASIDVYAAEDGTYLRSMQQGTYGPGSNATDRSGTINLFESAIVADVLGQGAPSVVKYALTLGQAANLLLVGQNTPYNHLIGAWDGETGTPLPAFPTITDDYQFLSSSTVAKVDAGSPANQVLAGTGLGLLHAYDGATGLDAPGFPKVTGGWLFAPAELSGDGRVAAITREGFLFEWNVPAPPCQSEWPTFRHDQQGSGNYDADGTPPGAPRDAMLSGTGTTRRLEFVSPGDDRRCGKPTAYVARVAGGDPMPLGPTAEGGTRVGFDVDLPESGTLIVQARDDAGNLGHPVRIAFAPPTVNPEPTVSATPTPTVAQTPTVTPTVDATPSPDATPTPAPLARPQDTPATPPGSSPGTCRDTVAPTSRFARARARRTAITLRGRSRDTGCGAGVARVFVAVNRAARGGRCRALTRDGIFSAPRSCHRTIYLPARGRTSWRVTLAGPFPRGNYTFWARAIDRAGNIERKASTRNRHKLRLR